MLVYYKSSCSTEGNYIDYSEFFEVWETSDPALRQDKIIDRFFLSQICTVPGFEEDYKNVEAEVEAKLLQKYPGALRMGEEWFPST